MSKLKLRVLVGIWSVAIVVAVSALAVGAEMAASKHVSPQLGKLEEADASSTMNDPNFGYVGELGSFEVTTKDDAEGMIVVHNYPDTSKQALGTTKLQFMGSSESATSTAGSSRPNGTARTTPRRFSSAPSGLLRRRRLGLHRWRLPRRDWLGRNLCPARHGAGAELSPFDATPCSARHPLSRIASQSGARQAEPRPAFLRAGLACDFSGLGPVLRPTGGAANCCSDCLVRL